MINCVVIDFNAFVPKNTFATYLYPWGSAYVISFLLTTSTLERRHIFITMFLKLESYLEHMRMRIDPSRILGANATAKFLRVFPKNEVHAFYSNMFKQLNQSVIDDNIHPKT